MLLRGGRSPNRECPLSLTLSPHETRGREDKAPRLWGGLPTAPSIQPQVFSKTTTMALLEQASSGTRQSREEKIL